MIFKKFWIKEMATLPFSTLLIRGFNKMVDIFDQFNSFQTVDTYMTSKCYALKYLNYFNYSTVQLDIIDIQH